MRIVGTGKWTVSLALVALALSANNAMASSILGGSDLLNMADADLLEGWLGEGELQFTNIFDKGPGDDSYDFHAAADGAGRTFSLIEVVDSSGNTLEVIGGYNPQSWNSTGTYNVTQPDSERTAFIFNLTDSRILRQILVYGGGALQTYNHSVYGPSFGGGHDIWVNQSLSQGYTLANSYAIGVNNWSDSLTGIIGVFSSPLQKPRSLNFFLTDRCSFSTLCT